MNVVPTAMPDEHEMLFNTPAKIVEAGERIYAEKYKARLEVERSGEFVVIDVLSGEAYIARFPEQALEDARTHASTGVFHLIRVGSPAAFRVRHVSGAKAPRDWPSLLELSSLR